MTGIFTCAALPQLVFTFFSSRLPRWAVFPGIWVGFAAGVGVWLGVAYKIDGVVNITSIGGLTPCLSGASTGLGTGIIICTLAAAFFPQQFDWSTIPALVHSVDDDGKEINVAEKDHAYDKKLLDRWLVIASVIGGTVFSVIFIIFPFSL